MVWFGIYIPLFYVDVMTYPSLNLMLVYLASEHQKEQHKD